MGVPIDGTLRRERRKKARALRNFQILFSLSPFFSFDFVLLGELAIGDKELSKERTEILSIRDFHNKKREKPLSSD